MFTIALQGTPRSQAGKGAVRRARKEGNIPCVLYTLQGPVHFSAEHNSLLKVLITPETYLVELSLDGQNYNAVVQESQFGPVHDELLHVDFIQVHADREVEVELPVDLTGTAQGVLAGGKLQQKLRRIRIRGLYNSLPPRVKVDVSTLGLGRSLKIREVAFEGFRVLSLPDLPICSVEVPRALRQHQGPR